MSEENKKSSNQLEESELDRISGGGAKEIEGVDITIKKKPIPKPKPGA